MTTKIWRRAGLLALVAVMLVTACDFGSSGGSGNFRFFDRTPDLEVDLDNEIDRALVAGGRMRVAIESNGEDAQLAEATSSDEAIFKVTAVNDGVVVIDGVAPGTATLEVLDSSGVSDFIDIEVQEAAEVEVTLLPWTPLLALPDHVLGQGGMALLPDSPLEVFASYRDASGQRLTGFSAHDWSLSANTEATISPQDSSDFATLRSGLAPEAFSLTRDEVTIDFQTVTEADVATVQLYGHTDDVGPSPADAALELEAGQTHLMHLAAYLEDGTYVVGAGTEPLEIVAGEDAAGVLEIGATPANANGEEEGDDDLARILANGRAFTLQPLNTGEATINVTWLGQTTTFTINVVAPE